MSERLKKKPVKVLSIMRNTGNRKKFTPAVSQTVNGQSDLWMEMKKRIKSESGHYKEWPLSEAYDPDYEQALKHQRIHDKC